MRISKSINNVDNTKDVIITHADYNVEIACYVAIDRIKVRTKFEVRRFTRSWDNRGYPTKLGSP